MYFVVTLALKILIYASVNCGFSGFASLKLHLFIQPLKRKEMTKFLFSHLHFFGIITLVCRNLC